MKWKILRSSPNNQTCLELNEQASNNWRANQRRRKKRTQTSFVKTLTCCKCNIYCIRKANSLSRHLKQKMRAFHAQHTSIRNSFIFEEIGNSCSFFCGFFSIVHLCLFVVLCFLFGFVLNKYLNFFINDSRTNSNFV